MYTSIALLVLASGMIPTPKPSETPPWLTDYGTAYEKTKGEKKPLAAFFGKGEAGWDQLSNNGALGEEALRVLRSEYVPVYLDVERDHGRTMASAFRVTTTPALVLTDRSGESIALRYAGTLEPAALHRCLVRYADPNRVVRTTDTDLGDGPDSYREAVATARQAGRPLLLVFHGPHCPWCKRMEHDTFADGRVRVALRRYVVYRVNTEQEPAVTRKFLPPMSPIPAYCLVRPADETARKAGDGYRTPAEFLDWLE
jgi:thioredoxin-related protein